MSDSATPSAQCADGYTRPVDVAREIEITQAGLVRVCKQLHLGELHTSARAAPPNEPCIVFLTYTDGIRITHMREGGRVSPNNVHYALDPSWFTFDPDTRRPVGEGEFGGTIDSPPCADADRKPLYLLKGIAFDRFGYQPTLWEYSPPRLVTYLAQGFSDGNTDSFRNDGVVLERYADTPLCSTLRLEQLVGDKLHTRILLACNDVGFPATLAFVFKPTISYVVPKELTVQVFVVEDRDAPAMRASVVSEVEAWLRNNPTLSRIVVKPSGPSFMQSRGVSFHDSSNAESIVDAACALIGELHAGDTVLVEEFLKPMPPRTVVNAREAALVCALRGKQPARGRELMSIDDRLHLSKISRPGMGHRLRVVVQRTVDDRCEVVTIVCGIGDLSKPIGGCNTIARTFDQFCDVWGVAKGIPREEARRAVCIEAERTLQAIIDFENRLSAMEKGSPQGQTDSIGLDMILSMRNGVIVPAVIEVNGFDSTSQSQELEYCIPRLHGNVVRTWLTTAVKRSALYMIRRKHVVSLASGASYAHRAILTARKLDVRVSLVVPNEACVDTETRDQIAAGGHALYVVHGLCCTDWNSSAALVQEALGSGAVDGVVGFGSTLGPIVCALSKRMGVVPMACEVLSVEEFQQAMVASYAEPMWHCCCPPLLVLDYKVVRTPDEVEDSAAALRAPILVRPNVGAGDIGARMAFSTTDAALSAVELLAQLKANAKEAEFALGTSVVLSSYKDGSLHDVYILVHDGELVTGFVADVGPPNLPGSVGPTAYRLPTAQDADTEQTLISMVYFVLNEMKVGNGVYRCQMQLRAGLPTMTNIDACAGGGFLSDCCEHVFGFSLCDCALFLSCGIRPAIPKPRKVRSHVIATVLYKSRHECVRTEAGLAHLEKLVERDVLAMWPMYHTSIPGGVVLEGSEEPERLVACYGETPVSAEAALRTALDVLAVDEDGTTAWFVCNM